MFCMLAFPARGRRAVRYLRMFRGAVCGTPRESGSPCQEAPEAIPLRPSTRRREMVSDTYLILWRGGSKLYKSMEDEGWKVDLSFC